jgi:peptidyl-tRNA hydrolase
VPVKQVIVVRHKFPNGKGGTISPRLGKTIAQACHAAQKWIVSRVLNSIQTFEGRNFVHTEVSQAELEWMNNGFKKVVLRCKDEAEILSLRDKAVAAGFQVHIIYDEAKTEFIQSEYTALAIGPDDADKINAITGDLQLL